MCLYSISNTMHLEEEFNRRGVVGSTRSDVCFEGGHVGYQCGEVVGGLKEGLEMDKYVFVLYLWDKIFNSFLMLDILTIILVHIRCVVISP